MAELILDWEGWDEAIAALDSFVPVLERELREGAKAAGKFIVTRARERTVAEGAIGATKGYYNGWAYEPDRVASVQGKVINTANHAPFAEFGRDANKPMPPHTRAFEQWMIHRGLDPKLSFVIRRAIGRKGTIQRKAYKGFEILAQIEKSDRDAVFAILDRYLGQAIERAWR